MNWYDIEYSTGRSSKSVMGSSGEDIELILNSPNIPKFIKLENVCYFSKITNKYELFDKWDSKWTNEIIIKAETIVSVRKIKINLLKDYSIGEIHIASESEPLTLVISDNYLAANKSSIDSSLSPAIDEIVKKGEALLGIMKYPIKIVGQPLVKENEFLLVSFGNIVFRKQNARDLPKAILKGVKEYAKQ